MTDTAPRPVIPVSVARAGIPETAAQVQGERAGLASRGAACAADAAVTALVLAGTYVVVAAVEVLANPRRFAFPSLPAGSIAAIASASAVAYLTTCWTLTGRTYGALLLG